MPDQPSNIDLDRIGSARACDAAKALLSVKSVLWCRVPN